jgi:hypothetical protein
LPLHPSLLVKHPFPPQIHLKQIEEWINSPPPSSQHAIFLEDFILTSFLIMASLPSVAVSGTLKLDQELRKGLISSEKVFYSSLSFLSILYN